MRLEFSRRAREDLARVYDFNLDWGEASAARVQDRLMDRAYALTAVPGMGRPFGDQGAFRLSIPDIQYVIDYELKDGAVRILRVRHTREIR